MSYDLLVFNPEAAPTTRTAFMKWFEEQTDWMDDYNYNYDPNTDSGKIQRWYLEMQDSFPDMNGPDEPNDDSDSWTGYSYGSESIYADFRWSAAERAYETVFALAKKHGVGFFDVSASNDDIYFPQDGELVAIDNLSK